VHETDSTTADATIRTTRPNPLPHNVTTNLSRVPPAHRHSPESDLIEYHTWITTIEAAGPIARIQFPGSNLVPDLIHNLVGGFLNFDFPELFYGFF
jgi:hypothetical protein